MPGSPVAPNACNTTKASRAQGHGAVSHPVATQRPQSRRWHRHRAVWPWRRPRVAPRRGLATAVSGEKRGRRWPVLGGRMRGMWGPDHVPGTAWGGQGSVPSDVVAASSMAEVLRGTSKGEGPLRHPLSLPGTNSALPFLRRRKTSSTTTPRLTLNT